MSTILPFGVSNTAELTRLIEEKRKTGVYLTVLGYGMGNRDKMASCEPEWFIETPEELMEV